MTRPSTKRKRNKGKGLRRSVCSPTRRLNRYTCYTDGNLERMKRLWNARHPDAPIKASSPKDIWKALRDNMRDACDTERCWLRQKFMKHKLNPELTTYTFAPTAPSAWKNNPDEWLTSVDIDKVMKQWEKKYKDYESYLFDPSPPDNTDTKQKKKKKQSQRLLISYRNTKTELRPLR